MNFLVCAGHVNEDELQFDNVLFSNSQKIKTLWKASFYHFFIQEKKTRLFLLKEVKPISPKSHQHRISPYNINALENRVVMRIEYKIREDECN